MWNIQDKKGWEKFRTNHYLIIMEFSGQKRLGKVQNLN